MRNGCLRCRWMSCCEFAGVFPLSSYIDCRYLSEPMSKILSEISPSQLLSIPLRFMSLLSLSRTYFLVLHLASIMGTLIFSALTPLSISAWMYTAGNQLILLSILSLMFHCFGKIYSFGKVWGFKDTSIDGLAGCRNPEYRRPRVEWITWRARNFTLHFSSPRIAKKPLSLFQEYTRKLDMPRRKLMCSDRSKDKDDSMLHIYSYLNC